MPTLEDINRIKSQLLEIGHEPSILAERGEEPVDIEPPETGLPDDLNELLSDGLAFDESASDELDVPDFSDMVPEAAKIEEEMDEFSMDDTNVLEAGLGMEESENFSHNKNNTDTGETGGPVIDEGAPEQEEEGAGSPDEFDLSMDDEAFSLPDREDEGEDLFGEEDFENPADTAVEDETPGAEEDFPDEFDLSMDDEAFSLPEREDEGEDLFGEEDFENPADTAVEDETPGTEEDFPDEFDLSMDDDLSESDADFSNDKSDLDLEEFEVADDEAADEDFEIDEFNLGDLGQDFGVLDESEDLVFTSPETPSVSTSEVSGESAEENGGDEQFQISDEDFRKLTKTLNTLPLNLKLVIEEYIGEKNLPADKLKRITDALIEGKSPKEIASVTGKVTGQRIKIPSGYEKRSGINFEEEKESFSYLFKHTILPLLEMIFIGIVAIAALTFVGYKFVYKPVYALILYDKGYNRLEDHRYAEANEYFDRAVEQKIFKKQFYRYAEGFIRAKQWDLAAKKYDALLSFYPLDKKGTLDYARMEFKDLFNYEKASSLLKKFLSVEKNVTDYDALLLYGDVNLEWGSENPSRYEVARRAYARIMENYGVQNKILFRMMKYFIRTDDPEQVRILKLRFQADKKLKIDPAVYAELAEYQINRNDLGDVKEILMRAKSVDPTLPEIHYQLARYFRKTGDTVEEDKALSQALHYLKLKEPLSSKRREELIDVYRRTGERAYAKKEYIHAQEYYTKGIALLEESRKLNVIHPGNPDYGRMYADLGDIYYFQSGDLDRALTMYETAEKEEYHATRLYYKIGYIYYTKNNYKKALLNFYNAAGNFSTNTNLLFATAVTLYDSNDLFMAQGYYNHLLDILENRLQAEIPLQLNFRSDQRKLLKDLIAATNNLGVTLYGLYERTGKPDNFTQALVSFTESDDYYDRLTRNEETMVRSKSINLAFLNQKKLLYPVKGYTLQIYRGISKDMDYMNFD